MSTLFAVVAWVGAVVATIAAAMLNATVMGVSGLIAALAALAWGFTVHPGSSGFRCPACTVDDSSHHVCIGREFL